MGRRCRRLGRWDIRQILVALALIPSIRTAAQSLVVSEANCSLADEAQNASVTLTWTLFDGAVNYTRISHSSEALLSTASSLPDRLLILGGIEYESAQPVVDSPVLVYNIATNVFLKPQDQILSAVSAAYQPTGSTIESVEFLNDTWRGCVDASSSNVVWDELVTATDATTVAAAPVPRIGHSFTKVFENSTTIGALVFGGLSGDYIELRGLHLALIAKASSSASPACTNPAPLTDSGAVPTARAYHAAMTTSRLFTASRLACLVVHGGKSTQEGVIFNELWRLCPPLAPDSAVPVERLNYTWELLTEIGTTPGARYGASMTFVDEGKLALAGGSYTFPSDFLSDTWELNVNATQWVRLSFSEDYAPPRRGHSLSFFSTTTRLFLFGGRDRYAVVSKRMQAAYYGAPFCAMGLKITFCTATSKYVCIACPAGSYLESGSRRCLLCPQGTFSSAGSAECTKCPAGTFSSDVGKDSRAPCTACPAGTFSQAVGAVSSAACSVCAAGTFAAASGSVACSSCVAGTFSGVNASVCTACPRGKYSSAGAGTCTNCAAGTYIPSTGSTSCLSCPRGFFSNSGDVGCSACPANTYSSSIGASASDCRACPSYAFTTSSGQSACQFCSPGSSWTGDACTLCSKGLYSSTGTSGACVACPKGSYAADRGSSSCRSCESLQAIQIPISQLLPRTGCRFFTLSLVDLTGASTSAVSSDSDNKLTVYVDDMNGGSLGATGSSVASSYALAASSVGNSPLDWDWVSKGLVASSDTLTAGGSVTLSSALIDQLRSQNVFAFTLSSMQVTFPSGSDVMKSVAYGTTAAIPAVLRQAFEEKDSALPSSANTLNDPAGLVSSVQVTSFSSGSSSLPVVRVSMKPFPTPAQLEAFTLLTITVGIPGGSFISIEIHSASTHLSLKRTYPGSFFAAGEWNYGYSQSSIPWELSSLSIALTCNTSSPGFAVEWAALGLLPDPDFACKCPRGFYHDTLSDEGGDGSCVRCAAGSFCAAGIKRRCPDGTFSFGKAASCETCRDGWICTDGLARLCDPGTYSTPSFTCGICPSGYACRNGKKSICPAGKFSPKLSSECQSCPPGTISRSEGSSTCELCPLGWTSNYQRNHCISCPPASLFVLCCIRVPNPQST
uniref:Tyrosine-protein kinase ephrin type A/B receptor-like domain-containing protein n=1 Tax=Phytophthora ramorum TaxID=164328 RepID=H3HE72_PHYRM